MDTGRADMLPGRVRRCPCQRAAVDRSCGPQLWTAAVLNHSSSLCLSLRLSRAVQSRERGGLDLRNGPQNDVEVAVLLAEEPLVREGRVLDREEMRTVGEA